MKKHIIIFTSILVFILCCVGIYLFKNSHTAIEKTIVNTETLKSERIDNAEIYQGVLISRQSVIIQPQVSGQISSINVKAGDKVQKGQVLIVIDPRKQEAILNSYQVKHSSLVTAYETAKIQYERYADLYERKTISKQDLENYENEYKKAKSALDENTAQIKEQSVQLGYHKITAPFSGVVGDVPVKIGEYVSPQTKLLSVTQNEILELNAGLPAKKIFDIKQGLPVQILDFDNNVIAESHLMFVSPRIDSGTQTILVKANFKNEKYILKADQSVKIRIIYNEYDGILIPVTSAVKVAGQDFVYLAKEENGELIAKQVHIETGDIQNGKYIIKSGLKSGDNLIIKGVQKLYDGAAIQQGEESL